jgi:cytochrome c oxidase subunit 4
MTTHDGNAEHGQQGHGHGDDHVHNHGGVGKYLAVFAGLLVLTAISFYIGNSQIKVESPRVAWVFMMAVSCGKALLVMLFFMHLIWEANWKYVLTIPASLMSVFLVLMLVPDIGLRTRRYSAERWLHAATPAPEHLEEEFKEEAKATKSKAAEADSQKH